MCKYMLAVGQKKTFQRTDLNKILYNKNLIKTLKNSLCFI